MCSVKLEAMVSELLKDLMNEARSVKPEAKLSEPVNVRKREFFCARFALSVNVLASVLKMVFFSARPEALVNDAAGFRVQTVATPACSVQETGVVVEAWVEVNIVFIVSMIEPANVLKNEFFSPRLEAGFNEPLSALKIESFSARVETSPKEALSDLAIGVDFAKLEARVRDPLRL